MANNPKAVLKNKGRLYVFDEAAGKKKFTEISVIDSFKFSAAPNVTEIKTPSGVSIMKVAELDPTVTFDLYNPADMAVLELLYRGAVTNTVYGGSTAQNEKVTLRFRKAGEAMILPGYNGAATAVTVNSVKSSDGTITYTVSTHYTVAVDTTTGMTMIVQVSGGTIPLNTDIIVDYDYTPLASQILRPVSEAALVERFLVCDVVPDCAAPTKYLRYFFPRATITSSLDLSNIALGRDNTSPNILPITLSYAQPDQCSTQAAWYIHDSNNV